MYPYPETVGSICTAIYRNPLLPPIFYTGAVSIYTMEHTTVTHRAEKSGPSEEFSEESPPRNRPVETKNCSMDAWQLTSTICAGMLCSVTHSLDVSGQRHKPLILNPAQMVEMRRPHTSPPSAEKGWYLRNKGVKNIRVQQEFSCHSICHPHHTFIASASLPHKKHQCCTVFRQEGD